MPAAQINGFEMYYEVTGSGQPLAYIHGGFGGIQALGPMPPWFVEKRFAPHFTVVTYHRRGCGRSEMTPEGHDVRTYAADLHALVQHLRLAPATLMGVSAGGPIAIQFALDHPELVARLVLVRSAADPMAGEQGRTVRTTVALLADLVRLRGADVFLELESALGDKLALFAPEHRGLPAAFQRAAASLTPEQRAALFEIWVKMSEAYDGLDLAPELGGLRMPVLIVHGQADTVIPVAGAIRTHAALPNADLQVLPGEPTPPSAVVSPRPCRSSSIGC